jgi:hypothetical protein
LARKPIVVHIEEGDNGTRTATYKRALDFILREDLGCEVYSYNGSWDFKDDVDRIKKYAQLNLVILVIVEQSKYLDTHTDVIEIVRSEISTELPINVLPNYWRDDMFSGSPEDRQIYAYGHHEKELTELVKSLVAAWQPPIDWLGAKTQEDQAILMGQLENAYRTHYLTDDEHMIGTPDSNTQIVTEALRLKLLPSMFLRQEFDSTLAHRPHVFTRIEKSIYEEELDRIRGMSDIERQHLCDTMSRARGHEPLPDGGVLVKRSSCGSDISGYAIDPETLQTTVVDEYGLHASAEIMLREQLEAVSEIRGDQFFEERPLRVIVPGLIFKVIEGFQTPLLRLFIGEFNGTTPEIERRLGRFIIREQKYIPLDHKARVIEG